MRKLSSIECAYKRCMNTSPYDLFCVMKKKVRLDDHGSKSWKVHRLWNDTGLIPQERLDELDNFRWM